MIFSVFDLKWISFFLFVNVLQFVFLLHVNLGLFILSGIVFYYKRGEHNAGW